VEDFILNGQHHRKGVGLVNSDVNKVCIPASYGKPLQRPQHCLYFFPLPHGQGSLRPTFGPLRTGLAFSIAAAASLTMSLPCAGPRWAVAELSAVAVVPPPNALAL
jgi:hypothetical protein